MRKNFICFVIAAILAVNYISALATENKYDAFLPAGGTESITVNIVDPPEESELETEEFYLSGHGGIEEAKQFYSYGSDYAYKDIELREDQDFRFGIYDAMLEACQKFAVSNEDVEYQEKHEYSFDTIEYSIDGVAQSDFKETANYYFPIVSAVYSVFKNDHPEFYWLSNDIYMFASIRGTASNSKLNIGMYMNVYDEYAEASYRHEMDEKIEENTQAYIDTISESDANDNYSISKLLHDMIINDVDYAYDDNGDPLDTPQAHSIVGVLDGDPRTNVVCEGYAKTYQLILNAVGVENVYVSGYAYNGIGTEGHAWNMVKLNDGEYYNFDVTWDDQKYEQFRYNYFAKGIGFYSDHFPMSPEYTGVNFLYELPEVPENDYTPIIATPEPDDTPKPTETAEPDDTPDPTETAEPDDTPDPTVTPNPDNTDTPPQETKAPEFEIEMKVDKVENEDGSKAVKIVLDKVEDDSSIFVAIKNKHGEIIALKWIPVSDMENYVDIIESGSVEVYAWKDTNSKPLAKMRNIEFE